MPVSIVADSAASLPPELALRNGITIVPMLLTVGGQTFPDGELPLDAVAACLDQGVATSAPTPGQFLQAIETANTGQGVVVLTVATTMSSSFDAASLAVRQAGIEAEVVDTGTAAGGEALITLAATEASRDGLDVAAVATAARHVASRVRLVATLDSLEHLARSGRVPEAAALASKWLHLQAMFEFVDGRARPLRPAHSKTAALDRIIERWRTTRSSGARLHVAALHARDPAPAHDLLARVRAQTSEELVTAFTAPFSAVMIAHTGPGLVGLSWWWEPSGQG